MLPLEVLKQFRIIYKSVKTHFNQIEDNCRITGSQLWALSVIAKEPGIQVSGLARAMAVHQSTASNLVERLVALGLASKERAEQDHRRVHLSPSEAGLALVRGAPLPFEGVLPHALALLPLETLEQLHKNLAETISHMQRVENSGAHTPMADL